MPFHLLSFLFLGATFIVYYLLHKRLRPYVLLIASWVYIHFLSPRAFHILVATALIVYAAGMLTDVLRQNGKEKGAKAVAGAGTVLLVATLLLFKYASHLAPLFADGEAARDAILARLILPMGFSYYSFQCISYLIDIAKGKIRAEKHPLIFLLYLCFFPKFVSGPIERADHLMHQLKSLPQVHFFDEPRYSLAATDLLYGYFMKVVVADRLSLFTTPTFAASGWHSTAGLIINIFFYTFQLYCDFAGYSALAVGTARLFGIDLVQNFNAPYLSLGITEFWRRWHMSLSAWLRDYLYIPLGGNRKGTFRKCVNILIVFLVCGIWHGASATFLIWGLLHGLYSVIETLFRKGPGQVSRIWQIIGRLLTFLGAAFAWFFFGIPSMSEIPTYVQRMLTTPNPGFTFEAELMEIGMGTTQFVLAWIFLIPVILSDLLICKTGMPFADAVKKWEYGYRYLLFYLLILVIFVFGIYGGGYDTGSFMYMDF